MNLKHFEYILEISKCGSINKAAQNLYISQPTLSGVVKALEQELCCTMFSRTNMGVELTPAGRLFLESAEIILSEVEKVKRISSQFAEQESISVCCTYSSLFMQAFIDFRRRYPASHSQDSIRETGMRFLMVHLLEKSNRAAVYYCFRKCLRKHSVMFERYNMSTFPLGENVPLVGMMSRRHPITAKSELTLGDLHNSNFVVYGGFDRDDWLDVLGFPPDSEPLVVYDRGGMFDVLKQGKHIAVLVANVEGGAPSADFVARPVVDISEPLDVLLLHPKSYCLNPRERQFTDFLKERLKSVGKC